MARDPQSETNAKQGKRIPAIFYRTAAGGEPVREWLKALSQEDRKRLYEVRTSLVRNRIARVLFYIDKKSRMVLLHGFIKKTRQTSNEDLDFARTNKSNHQSSLK